MNGIMDIALSSRVRLARNIAGLPFPNCMTQLQMQQLVERVDNAIGKENGFMMVRMRTLPLRERRVLVERHLISADLARTDAGAALINKEETVSILIGEEDHLRIQCIQPGLQLMQTDAACVELDKMLCAKLPYAFDPKLGYVTACPTNIGSAMRASVMVHLPVLSLLGQADALLSAISKLGYAVRGIYGEGSGAPGHIYQISNQITLGILEEDILSNLNATVQRIMERERSLRVPFYHSHRVDAQDRVYRSLGALRFARRLKAAEAMEYLSNLKLGASIGLLPDEAHAICNRLLTDVQSASIEQRTGEELTKASQEEARARFIRKEIEEIEQMYHQTEIRGEDI